MNNASFTLILYCTLSFSLAIHSWTSCPQYCLFLETLQNTSATTAVETDLEFKEIMIGEAVATDGTKRPFHTWKASDGVSVTSSTQEFRLPIQAKRAFLKRLHEASIVAENKARVDRTGRIIGQRAVVTFSYPKTKSPFHGIVWTNGSVFHDVESVSLRHATAFVEKFYPAENVGRVAQP